MNTENVLLIAEDEEEVRDALVAKLEPLGFPIVVAKDGLEMLNMALKDTRIVAILSDIKMPALNGLDALKKIREHQIETPIIFLTAFGDKKLVTEALRFGAMDFLDKPWDGNQLLRVVQQALEVGLKIKDVDQQLDILAAKYAISSADLEKFRSIQKPVLLMKLKNEVFFKKKTA